MWSEIRAKDMQMSLSTEVGPYFFPAGELKNGTMLWAPIKYRNSTTVGSEYSYDSKSAVLTIKQEGTYFLYTQLNLTCTGLCSSGSLSVTFEGDQRTELLSCSLHLPKVPSHPIVEKCWTVVHRLLTGSKVIAKMHGRVSPSGWQLDLNHSGFGVFLVD